MEKTFDIKDYYALKITALNKHLPESLRIDPNEVRLPKYSKIVCFNEELRNSLPARIPTECGLEIAIARSCDDLSICPFCVRYLQVTGVSRSNFAGKPDSRWWYAKPFPKCDTCEFADLHSICNCGDSWYHDIQHHLGGIIIDVVDVRATIEEARARFIK